MEAGFQMCPSHPSLTGYDVWMMNNRGNTFARKQAQHSDLSPDFWRFSLDELITIDLPDTLNYVLQATGYKTVRCRLLT